MRITLLALVQLGLLLVRLSHFEPVTAASEEELFEHGFQRLAGGNDDASPSTFSSIVTGLTDSIHSWLPWGETPPGARPRPGTRPGSSYPSRTVEQNVPRPAQALQPNVADRLVASRLKRFRTLFALSEQQPKSLGGIRLEVSNDEMDTLKALIGEVRRQNSYFGPGSQESRKKAVENMVKVFAAEVWSITSMDDIYRYLYNGRSEDGVVLSDLREQIRKYKRSLDPVAKEFFNLEREYERTRRTHVDLNMQELGLSPRDGTYIQQYDKATDDGVQWRT